MRRLLFLILVVIFALKSQCAITEEKTNLSVGNKSQNCELTFGFTEWKPLQYLDADGTPIGIQIDLSKAVLKELGCKIKFEIGTWSDSLRKIKEGKIDFTANATATPERKEYGIFSSPYRRDEFAIFVRQADKEKYAKYSIEELKRANFRLGLTKNYLYGKEIEAWQVDQDHSHLLTYVDLADDNVQKLFNKEIDGLLFDPFEVAYKLRSKDLSKRIVSLPIRTFGREVSFIFSKKKFDKAFIQRFNEALDKVVSDPKNQSIWIKNNI